MQNFSREINFEKHSLDREIIILPSRLSVSSLIDNRYSKLSLNILNDDIEDFQYIEDIENVQEVQDRDNVQEGIENVQDTENVHCNKSTQNKRFSDIEDINKKRRKTLKVYSNSTLLIITIFKSKCCK